MIRRYFLLCILSLSLHGVFAQVKNADSTLYYNELFTELESFLDSISAPRNMLIVNVGLSNNFINSKTVNQTVESNRRLILSPSIGFYSKSGLGINLASFINDVGTNWNLYQWLGTASYDYLKGEKFLTGINYTRFFTKDSVAFYVSPLENEFSAYLMYKPSNFKPSLTASYGWGTMEDFKKGEQFIDVLKKGRGRGLGNLPPIGESDTITTQKINDFTLSASVRRDYVWLRLLGKNNVTRLIPQLTFTSGTQRFGFNQTSNSYKISPNNKNNVLYNTDNVELEDNLGFQPLSLAFMLRSEISFGKFYLQPQFITDYYFPAKEQNLLVGFRINTGFIF
ncbi:MAG: hypothetical protein H0V91_09225 [Flavisolibacter sp.]|jgi:hypothetical protein|nr:hypothetical protein [Flavisolibacter sp.]